MDNLNLDIITVSITKGLFMSKIPKEDEELLLQLIEEKKLPEKLILKLVKKALDIRYQDRVIGFKDELSDLIKEYANDKKDIS